MPVFGRPRPLFSLTGIAPSSNMQRGMARQSRAVTSDELARQGASRVAGRPAPTPLAAHDRSAIPSRLMGGLAELAIEQEVGTLSGGGLCLAARKRDVRRLMKRSEERRGGEGGREGGER